MADARLGTSGARLGLLPLGENARPAPPPPPAPPDPDWWPADWTLDRKVDEILRILGKPREDVRPGFWTIREGILVLAGYEVPLG